MDREDKFDFINRLGDSLKVESMDTNGKDSYANKQEPERNKHIVGKVLKRAGQAAAVFFLICSVTISVFAMDTTQKISVATRENQTDLQEQLKNLQELIENQDQKIEDLEKQNKALEEAAEKDEEDRLIFEEDYVTIQSITENGNGISSRKIPFTDLYYKQGSSGTLQRFTQDKKVEIRSGESITICILDDQKTLNLKEGDVIGISFRQNAETRLNISLGTEDGLDVTDTTPEVLLPVYAAGEAKIVITNKSSEKVSIL